jgi:hypothetical protein
VLKKVALIAATSAAAAVAAAPFAMATEGSSTGIDKSGKGLFNVSGNDVNVPIQACNNDFPINGGVGAGQVNVKDLVGSVTGAAGILGKASASSAVATDSSRSCGLESGAGDAL